MLFGAATSTILLRDGVFRSSSVWPRERNQVTCIHTLWSALKKRLGSFALWRRVLRL